jgi:hypothetical protein
MKNTTDREKVALALAGISAFEEKMKEVTVDIIDIRELLANLRLRLEYGSAGDALVEFTIEIEDC